jgi:hypothetical protein
MSDKPDNTKRLTDLVGFDPAKKPSASETLFKEVLADIQKERDAKAREVVRTQLAEAIRLREEMHKAESEFNKQKQKFDSQLGKLLNSLENSLRGRPQVEEAEDGSQAANT